MTAVYGYTQFEFDEENDLKNYGAWFCDVSHGTPPWKPTVRPAVLAVARLPLHTAGLREAFRAYEQGLGHQAEGRIPLPERDADLGGGSERAGGGLQGEDQALYRGLGEACGKRPRSICSRPTTDSRRSTGWTRTSPSPSSATSNCWSWSKTTSRSTRSSGTCTWTSSSLCSTSSVCSSRCAATCWAWTTAVLSSPR